MQVEVSISPTIKPADDLKGKKTITYQPE